MLELRKRADRTGDPLRTVWRHGSTDVDITAKAAKELNKAAVDAGIPEPLRQVEVWPSAGVELVGDAPKDHSFADSFVARALEDGYLSFENMRVGLTDAYDRGPVITGDVLVLDVDGGPLRYEILEHPGRYDDDNEPSGVRVTHEYRCRLLEGK